MYVNTVDTAKGFGVRYHPAVAALLFNEAIRIAHPQGGNNVRGGFLLTNLVRDNTNQDPCRLELKAWINKGIIYRYQSRPADAAECFLKARQLAVSLKDQWMVDKLSNALRDAIEAAARCPRPKPLHLYYAFAA